MSNRIGTVEASGVVRTLQELGAGRSVPADVRANAAHLARALERPAGRRDLVTAAWFLLEASKDRRIPRAQRKAARRWGVYLETRA
jgi:hypothetical protein